MVNMTNADKALKSIYLSILSNQLNNNTNPLLARFKQTTSDVWGKEVRKAAVYGLNGGFGVGDEDGALPTVGSNKYIQFQATLKNLFGVIELSDKAIRASENSIGAFVNLLNSEMENLIASCSFNFGRMLFGNGSGKLATISASSTSTKTITVNTVRNIMEGMIVDVYDSSDDVLQAGAVVLSINRATLVVSLSALTSNTDISYVTVQGSANKEITGLETFYDSNITSVYGLAKADYAWLTPKTAAAPSGIITDAVIQSAIDNAEDVSSCTIDFIVCAKDTKRFYQTHLGAYNKNIDILNLAGGYKAMSYNGIPIIADKFCPNGYLYALDTTQFNIHQLCDWKWLEGDDGRILRQNAGYATYKATLVKYAEMVCDKPSAQSRITGITAGA